MFSLLLAIIYLSFISLGLPDSVLGAAWPMIYTDFGVPISFAGIVSIIISAGTITSSLLSDRLTKWLGAGKVTAISVGLTAIALFGFSTCTEFWQMCLWALPYGLGAGSVDAALNNYVALHYASRHMSWLHCMWGVGTVIGPAILSYALVGGQEWSMGYRYISYLQIALTLVLILSLPLWKKQTSSNQESTKSEPLKIKDIFKISGAFEVISAFFCYCALESTASLWACSYMVWHNGIDKETAAGFASAFFVGITAGRFISGFLTYKLNDTQMVRLGGALAILGIVSLFLPLGTAFTVAGIVLIGLGCAPIYPAIIHSTPEHFGAENSQALIGVQMASAYLGSLTMPPLFGIMADHISVRLLPIFMLVISVAMVLMHERLVKKTKR